MFDSVWLPMLRITWFSRRRCCLMEWLRTRAKWNWNIWPRWIIPCGFMRHLERMVYTFLHNKKFWWSHVWIEWMLFQMESPRTGANRGLVLGRLYTRDGKLVVSIAQEGNQITRLNQWGNRSCPFRRCHSYKTFRRPVGCLQIVMELFLFQKQQIKIVLVWHQWSSLHLDGGFETAFAWKQMRDFRLIIVILGI